MSGTDGTTRPATRSTMSVTLERVEIVTIIDALQLLAVEHHRSRVLATDAETERNACEAEARADELRRRLDLELLRT